MITNKWYSYYSINSWNVFICPCQFKEADGAYPTEFLVQSLKEAVMFFGAMNLTLIQFSVTVMKYFDKSNAGEKGLILLMIPGHSSS